VQEWCGGAGRGRLIPLTLVPLWDPDLAAAEVRRRAEKGSHAVCFSENPVPHLKLPSIHTGHWDRLFAACEATETVVNLHIGSSSTFPVTTREAPRAVSLALTYQGASHALVDWLTAGVLERFPRADVRLRFRRRRRSAPARRHGYRADHVRGRLPARRLDMAGLPGRAREDHARGGPLTERETYLLARGNAIRCYGSNGSD
jgi:hypothetical protein